MPMPVVEARRMLESAHDRGRLAHALLICGPEGSGKEELAASLIQMVNPPADQGADLWGDPVEVKEKALDELVGEFVRVIRPLSKSRRIKVEQIRELEKPLYLSAPEGTWKVGVIVDADRMWDESANAFLKTLEEPPKDTLLLLLTSQPERLLPTIHSRCVELSLTERKGIEERWLERSGALEKILRELSQTGPNLWLALGLKGAFEEVLASIKGDLEKSYAQDLKEDAAHYKQASEGKWLEEQEEIMKAALAGEVLGARAALMEWLQAWLGDALRQRAGISRVQLPRQQESSRAFGQQLETGELLQRCDALRRMALNFETNAQDALVLECGFMEAFG
ncbi:MAG: hypothetical protein Q7Q71_00650 [Verrucomicrobiota bacterium JB023]|nr:hypothetical protein [Verrucomicrobiota bacterium JB023]